MATNPDQARRNQEANIAAALLLLGSRYDLPALIRRAKVRPRPFRPIAPTEALRGGLANPYLQVVRAWAAQQPAILAAYELALVTGDAGHITRQMNRSAFAVELERTLQERRLADVLERFERWHRQQWNARIKAATTLDVTILNTPGQVRAEASSAEAWNKSLIADVDRQAGAGITAALLAAVAIKASVATARADASEVIAKARRRSLAIGVDQIDRTSRSFDRARRRAAGLRQFRWLHSPHVKVPRKHHLARNNRTFAEGDIPADDRAGVPFGCQCYEIPVFE